MDFVFDIFFHAKFCNAANCSGRGVGFFEPGFRFRTQPLTGALPLLNNQRLDWRRLIDGLGAANGGIRLGKFDLLRPAGGRFFHQFKQRIRRC